MNYYKLKEENGDCKIVKGVNTLDVIKRYDLCSKKNVNTNIFKLEGEQLAIAIANEQE